MNVLICAVESACLTELSVELSHDGHLVRSVASAAAALELIARDPPDIGIISCDLVGDKFAGIVAAISGADELYRSVVALIVDDPPRKRVEWYEAGADDVAGASVTAQELASRVRSAERIVRLERRLRERVRELESAFSRLEMQAVRRGQAMAGNAPQKPPTEERPFLLTRSWTGIEEVLTKMCCDYLQAPFQLVAGTAVPPVGAPGTVLTLTDVDHDLRVDVSFFAPIHSATEIAAAFCGDRSLVDDDVIRDVLLELGNSGMGAVKGAFLNDGYKFVGSIPKSIPFVDFNSLLGGQVEAKRVLTFRTEKFILHAIIAARRSKRMYVKVAGLREGMVVASDIKTEAGALLVASGTRLTETTAERLRRLVPKTLEIELADPS